MSGYSREELDNLKEQYPMEIVVEALGGEIHGYGDYGYSSYNGWTLATCPVHDDEHPSAGISPDSAYFNCFGCGAHGDIFTLVQAAGKAKTFRGAVKWIKRELVPA